MLLNYREIGSGPALVILHGLFGSLDNWVTLGKQFAEAHTVYLVDQRNHGRSPHAAPMDYTTMAEDLRAFFEDHGIRKAAVLGHSMGGKTAMRFALDHPDLTEALIVADIAPKTYPPGHDAIFDGLKKVTPEQLADRTEAEEQLGRFIPDGDVRLFLLKNLTRNPEGGYRWKMNLPVIEQEYTDILGFEGADFAYDGPALFVRGGRSNYVEDADWPAIAELFPQASLQTIPNAGHWLHADQPRAFYEVVQRFLNSL
ncbi:MAG: alpha/beta fold hydrolase [Bacteroidetes bacterium]|nr:alpha/beta fold hydrolase [Bacteroidota bacterium]